MKTSLRRLLTLLLALAMVLSLLGVSALAAEEAGDGSRSAVSVADTSDYGESGNAGKDDQYKDAVPDGTDDDTEAVGTESGNAGEESGNAKEITVISPAITTGIKSNKISVKSPVFLTYKKNKVRKFQLKASAKGGAKLTYQSNNKRVKVSASGLVKVPKGFKGKFVITVKAEATAGYAAAKKKVTFMVGPAAAKLTSAKGGSKKITVKWKRCKSAKAFRVQVSKKKNFSKLAKSVRVKNKKSKATKTTVKGLKKGTYYVRIRSLDGSTYSAWSAVKTVRVK